MYFVEVCFLLLGKLDKPDDLNFSFHSEICVRLYHHSFATLSVVIFVEINLHFLLSKIRWELELSLSQVRNLSVKMRNWREKYLDCTKQLIWIFFGIAHKLDAVPRKTQVLFHSDESSHST